MATAALPCFFFFSLLFSLSLKLLPLYDDIQKVKKGSARLNIEKSNLILFDVLLSITIYQLRGNIYHHHQCRQQRLYIHTYSFLPADVNTPKPIHPVWPSMQLANKKKKQRNLLLTARTAIKQWLDVSSSCYKKKHRRNPTLFSSCKH